MTIFPNLSLRASLKQTQPQENPETIRRKALNSYGRKIDHERLIEAIYLFLCVRPKLIIGSSVFPMKKWEVHHLIMRAAKCKFLKEH